MVEVLLLLMPALCVRAAAAAAAAAAAVDVCLVCVRLCVPLGVLLVCMAVTAAGGGSLMRTQSSSSAALGADPEMRSPALSLRFSTCSTDAATPQIAARPS
eukprot:1155616-Pelagomonas_calceolata.AAC.18